MANNPARPKGKYSNHLFMSNKSFDENRAYIIEQINELEKDIELWKKDAAYDHKALIRYVDCCYHLRDRKDFLFHMDNARRRKSTGNKPEIYNTWQFAHTIDE